MHPLSTVAGAYRHSSCPEVVDQSSRETEREIYLLRKAEIDHICDALVYCVLEWGRRQDTGL